MQDAAVVYADPGCQHGAVEAWVSATEPVPADALVPAARVDPGLVGGRIQPICGFRTLMR